MRDVIIVVAVSNPTRPRQQGPSAAGELPQHNSATMVYNVGGDFHWLCYHTAAFVVTVIALFSTIMHI